MKNPVESIRLSKADKENLIRIKRKTGIESWNIMCRWALLMALADTDSRFRVSEEKRDALEIRWETFAGGLAEALSGLIHLAHSRNPAIKENVSLGDFLNYKLSDGIRRLSKAVEVESTAIFPESAPRLKDAR